MLYFDTHALVVYISVEPYHSTQKIWAHTPRVWLRFFLQEINLLKRLTGKKTVVQYIDSEIDEAATQKRGVCWISPAP